MALPVKHVALATPLDLYFHSKPVSSSLSRVALPAIRGSCVDTRTQAITYVETHLY